MIQNFNNICLFRQVNPGTPGNGVNVNNPILNAVKTDLRQLREYLETRFNNYRGFDFQIEASQGQGIFPSVLHICILPPNQTVSSGIYGAICFDLLGRGALVGCAESVTHPKGLNTITRKRRNVNLAIDVDGGRPTTKYNNAFENPKEFFVNQTSELDLLSHLSESLDIALYHLGLSDSPNLTIEARATADINNTEFDPTDLTDAREKISRQIAARRGQKKFRKKLLDTYNYQCQITESKVEEILEAAYILPYRGDQTNHIQNGLLLRSDIHLLFDLGLLTVDANSYKVKIHPSLNESHYFEYNNKDLILPARVNDYPNREALRHHNENEYRE